MVAVTIICRDKGVGTSSTEVSSTVMFIQPVIPEALNAGLLCARLVIKQLSQPVQGLFRLDLSSPANNERDGPPGHLRSREAGLAGEGGLETGPPSW